MRSECVARDHAGRIAIRFEGVGEQQVPGTAAAGITAGRRQPARSQVTASGQARGGGDEQGCTGWVKALGTVEVRRRPLLVADQ
ncbi:MAG TPA: hypothetical protein VGJ28_19405, partial [Micromonosporaceae bacterium]